MAAKTPDDVTNGEIERIVLGSRTLFILNFTTENLDDADTVDVNGLMSKCDGAWFQPADVSQTSAPGIAFSGTGNTTLTFDIAVANMTGQLFIVGTP